MYVQKLGEALAENNTLTLLNVESNYISADGIIAIIEGMNKNQIIQELRVSNQVNTFYWLIWHKCQRVYVIMNCPLCVGVVIRR